MYYKKDNARFLRVPIRFSQHEHRILTGQNPYFKRVLPLFSKPYVENGGSITKAAAIFNIGRATIYRWLSSEKLEATKVKHRQRKLDWKALSKDVQENPEARLRDRAEKFGVRPSAICYGEHLIYASE